MKTGIGQPVRRKEDARLVVGAGRFSDDVDLPRQTRAFVLRSCHAHARIKSIDDRTRQGAQGRARRAHRRRPQGRRRASRSRRMPRSPCRSRRSGGCRMSCWFNRDGPLMQTPYYPLAVDKVRYVGEGGGAGGRGDAGDRQGRRRACRDRLRARLPPVIDTAQAAEAGRAAAVGRSTLEHLRRLRRSATRPRPTRRLRTPRMW